MIFFTADLHLGHEEVIEKRQRPFASVTEMNEALIDNYNKRVGPDDTVYILGDLCHKIPLGEANALIKRLNGHKILLRGNHDQDYDPSLFEAMEDFLMTDLRGRRFVLMHYALIDWPRRKKGGIHLHGHMHESRAYNLENRAKGLFRYDAGVDANGYSPVSLEEILDFYKDARWTEEKGLR
ncbi:MAG: metallophosphoesterase [Lachnospiraceae bacterium]|nr:metallophosphoesterase [Lachnospiraceae bacterium]